jgi:hypothetical protein
MDRNCLTGISYRQNLDTCVLASYAVACFPFTQNPVLEYFVAYCRHFNLDQQHPERSYESHFHPLATTRPGYQIIRELHEQSTEAVFATARLHTTLSPVADWANDGAATETAIRQADCLLMLFVNALPGGRHWMHSIVVGHNGQGLYYFDTCAGLQPGPNRIIEFGNLGDAHLIKRR